MIHLDTSFLIGAGVKGSPEARRFRAWLSRDELVGISAVAWAEFLCGPVASLAADDAATLLGEPDPLSGIDATLASRLFNASGRRRGSLTDCMIAAIAMNAGATLATSNSGDFRCFELLGLILDA